MQGAACGAISTMSQIGMGLGVAVAAAFAIGKPPGAGAHDAFWSPAIFSVLTLLVSVTAIAGRTPSRVRLVRGRHLPALNRHS